MIKLAFVLAAVCWVSAITLVILSWIYFRPQIDLHDMSFSTRGLRWHRYWDNTWHTWFAFRCLCGDWTTGCGEHRFCGMCPVCKRILEDQP